MKAKTSPISIYELIIVTAIWLLIFILTPYNWRVDLPTEFYIKQVVFSFLLTGIYYLNASYLVDYLVRPKGLLKFVGWAILLICVSLIALQLFENSLGLPEKMHNAIRPQRPYHEDRGFRFDLFAMFFIILDIGLSSVVVLVRKNQKDTLEKQELEKQKISSELSFLKAQINPHFFFNTLNSIYALTDLNVEDAKAAIHTLSAMMRYVLYESERDNTTVQKEIEFIDNYIRLMKLRLTEKVSITFQKPPSEINDLIAPMLFLPFVENAFKHGVSNQQPSDVSITIQQENEWTKLKIENTIVPNQSQSLDEKGIGLNNTKRRLELIYPERHELSTEVTKDRYLVELKLKLH
jgi:two-component system LytT family sensor kinase